MNKWINTGIATATIILSGILLTGCQDDAQVASYNLSKAADNFEVQRRIVFINGITDEYLFEVIGKCSVEPDTSARKLDVTCRHAANDYRKHFLGISDNTPYLVEQLDSVDVSVYYTRITFKPQTIIPDVDFRGGSDNE